ncbi:hypothetical protein Patl1_34803 [Pistacia atlantica]|uniref:Uncharacterized protein n=1 Tax=Pistacia atlantica TaxID=434234 RepID=A0ACC0ZSI7_9ROSI|nr:hypothetical protein Patl1_34803 [Pistacia atlantica]
MNVLRMLHCGYGYSPSGQAITEDLKSIYLKALPFLHLKKILVNECPKLKKLPLDFTSAKERTIVIMGPEEWWKELQWEDEATPNAFLPSFNSNDQTNQIINS